MRHRGIHFAQRCKERGIHSVNPHELRREIEKAVAEQRDDLVTFVCPTANGRHRIFRFLLPTEGPFYAVVSPEGHAITVLTQEMIRSYKAVRKGRSPTLHHAQVSRLEDEAYYHARQRWRRKRRGK